MNSFFPHAINSWNIVIRDFEDFPSLDNLKKHVLSLFRPKNRSIFGVHYPVGLRYLLQLRVSLSSLRSHKMHHNFDDTPSENCLCKEGIEDTRHFLLFVSILQYTTSCINKKCKWDFIDEQSTSIWKPDSSTLVWSRSYEICWKQENSCSNIEIH